MLFFGAIGESDKSPTKPSGKMFARAKKLRSAVQYGCNRLGEERFDTS